MLRSVWSTFVERVGSIFKHLRGRPTNVRPDNAHTDSQLRDGLYRYDHPDSDIFLPRPVRGANLGGVDDHIRLMREIADKSNKPHVASQPDQPHICKCHPERTCNCTGSACDGDADCIDGDEWVRAYTDRATDYYDRIDRERNAEYVGKPYPVTSVPKHGAFECPVNGKACGSGFCTKGVCEESRSRAAAGKHWRFAKAADNH